MREKGCIREEGGERERVYRGEREGCIGEGGGGEGEDYVY